MGRVQFSWPCGVVLRLCAIGGVAALNPGCGNFLCTLFSRSPPESVITTDRYQLSRFPGNTSLASLRVVLLGGPPPYTYRWFVNNPWGERSDELLDSLERPTTRFIVGAMDGPYDVHCTVEDACGRRRTASIVLKVGRDIGLDATTQRHGVIAGGGSTGQTTMRLNSALDSPPFDITWICTGPDGNIDDDRLDTSDPMTPLFTSGSAIGTHVLTAGVVDSTGATSVESVIVIVGRTRGLDVTASRAAVAPGGGSQGLLTLLATPIGGRAPYEFDWEIIGPDSEPRNELLWDNEVRDPVFESGDETGTFVARCAVTDSEGTIRIGSTSIEVTPQISVDIQADRLALAAKSAAGDAATLVPDIRGGREPISLDWQVIGPSGNDDSALLTPSVNGEAVFTPGARIGSYVVRCTATDADNFSSTDSLVLTVGGALSVLLASDKTTLTVGGPAPTRTAQLRTQVYGGMPPYAYQWSVINPTGKEMPKLLTGTTQANPTFLGTSRVGPYTVLCTVTDSSGAVAVDEIRIHVGQPLNLDLGVDKQVLMADGRVSGQAQLFPTIQGGSPPYDFQWHVTNPNGLPEPSRLSDSLIAGPVFTSVTTTGTYRLTLTATDALAAVFVDTVELVVGSPRGFASAANLSIDVSVDRQTVSPLGGTASVEVTTIGGVPPLTYDWSVTAPGGEVDDGRLDSTIEPTAVFTSNATQGTYRIRCTVTDAVGSSFVDSVQLTVSDDFNLDVRSDVTHVVPGGAVELVADRSGGKANFTYSWSAVDDTGIPGGTFATDATGPGSASQVAVDDAANVWTAPSAESGIVGAYRITVVAIDAAGSSFTDSVIVNVTNAFLMDVTASAAHVVPGGSVNLSVDRTGGTPDFTYTWSSVNNTGDLAGTFTTGSTGPGAALQVAPDDVNNIWTAPPAGTGVLGTYRITVAATDAANGSFADTVEVTITEPFSINLATGTPVIGSGASTTIVADRSGGEPPFTYVWTASDAAGAPAGNFTAGSTGPGTATQAGLADDATNTWTAPVIAPGTRETYTIKCIAVDAFGASFTDSAQFVVGVDNALTIDLTADTVFLVPGQQVILTVKSMGGALNFDYTWSAVSGSGASGGTLGEVNQDNVAGDTTNTWSAPAAAAGTLGTYRIEVTVTDAAGAQFTDSVHVVVQSLLSLSVTANNTFVTPSAVVTLVADQSGGETTYGYAWSAKNSSGAAAGTFTAGATGTGTAAQNGLSGDATNGWSAATEGTYTITCTVTDNTGQTFTDSVPVVVTSQDVFSLNVTADKLMVAPGETVNLAGDRTGGTANFNYAWSAVNEAGAPAGTLGAVNQAGLANDTTNTWTAPTGGGLEGTYRISCTITDAQVRMFTDTIIVQISTLALQNIFLAPAATAINNILGATTFTPSVIGGDPGQQITVGLTNPAHPRNVVITIIDVNNSITGGTARVTGLDARGLTQSEVITIVASGGGSSTNTGVAPFATVTGIDLFNFSGSNPFTDQVSVGVGDKFGLTGNLSAAGDVLYVNEGGQVSTTGYTVDAAVGQQGLTFATAPNGARDYVVVFRAR